MFCFVKLVTLLAICAIDWPDDDVRFRACVCGRRGFPLFALFLPKLYLILEKRATYQGLIITGYVIKFSLMLIVLLAY